MEHLKQTFCRFDMVCDNPRGGEVEIVKMPDFFRVKPEIETSQLHVHPFYEVVWFEEGEGTHTVDFTEYPVVPGAVFFIAPGQIHSFDQHTSAKGYVLKICNGLLGNEGGTNDGSLLKYNVFNAYDATPCIHIDETVSNHLKTIINAIESELRESDSIGHTEYLRSLVKMLLIQFERNYRPETEKLFTPSKVSHKAFLSFRRALEHHFRNMHSVKEYAALLNVTTKTLSNYVAECSTYTPLEIINNRITLEAKRLLRYSDYMIKEVAFELGFDDPSYFVKFFKRQVGCSPAEYRTPE
ncbi:MAG: helix-turn-helix domain-containing protein [Bacteroidaceae bacterium]|nr:helix-turn-helix domain-containing protein [Bacteroidaceae bacterium]